MPEKNERKKYKKKVRKNNYVKKIAEKDSHKKRRRKKVQGKKRIYSKTVYSTLVQWLCDIIWNVYCICWSLLYEQYNSINNLNPLSYGEGALYSVRPPPSLVFCPLLKISLGNPYLKILDLKNLLMRMPLWKKKSKKIVLPPLRALWNMGPKTTYSQKG